MPKTKTYSTGLILPITVFLILFKVLGVLSCLWIHIFILPIIVLIIILLLYIVNTFSGILVGVQLPRLTFVVVRGITKQDLEGFKNDLMEASKKRMKRLAST